MPEVEIRELIPVDLKLVRTVRTYHINTNLGFICTVKVIWNGKDYIYGIKDTVDASGNAVELSQEEVKELIEFVKQTLETVEK